MEIEIGTLVERKKDMEAFTAVLNEMVKGTDDEEVKQYVSSFLAKTAEAYCFFVAGREKTGRTSLLRNCFLDGDLEALGAGETEGIQEIRYGAMEGRMQIEAGHTRCFVTNSALDGMVLYDIGGKNVYKSRRAGELAEKADVILAVFSSENIQDEYVWDFIEEHAIGKRVVCVLTKADLYTPEEIKKKKQKLQGYMEDMGIFSPVFSVSNKDGFDRGYEDLRAYICKNIIGINPAEEKRKENFHAMQRLREELTASIEKRNLQFQKDQKLLQRLDNRIRDFYSGQQKEIEGLKADIIRVIQEEIENYSSSIIRQFDPGELRRNPNTQNKKAFMQWLSHEVERYERILNNRVNEKVQRVMRHYILQIDEVCEEMTASLQERESLLEENDRFYGSLAAGKATIVERTRQVTELNHKEYVTLLSASEELFDKVWKARRRYELQMAAATASSTAVSAVGGGVVIAAVMTWAGVSVGGALAGAVIGGLVLGTLGYNLGKRFADIYFSGRMAENVSRYIEEFRTEAAEISRNLEKQTMERLDELFDNEFQLLDKNFLQFRTTTNIDAKNIPLLEAQLQEMNLLFNQIMEKEGCYEYC